MQLISPDVLAEARGLSPGAAGFLLFVGFLLWAFGWRWHKFWVVFAITLASGLLGLTAGRSAGTQVMVVGVLLAVAAGMLALELAKILAFVTGGVAAWVAAEAMLPQAQELWAVFMCGGLLGVALYRVWTMIATSFVGILVCWHSLLVMADSFVPLDAPSFAAEYASALNGGVLAAALLGVLVQARTGSEDGGGKSEEKKDDGHAKPAAHGKNDAHGHGHHHDADGHAEVKKPEKKTWLQWVVPAGKAA